MPDPLVAAVRREIARAGLVEPGDGLLVAVSGGQDSSALLHALVCLREELQIALHAAHLNHGLRSADSDADEEFVRELCGALGVPCTCESTDVRGASRRLHRSIEDTARLLRHAFLERIADSVGAARIAVGHTRDDRVETILLNILRGTGADGLRGLLPASGRLIRPLLAVAREETAAYCARHGVGFRVDASNQSLVHRRNRVREELLPQLESYYNLDVRDSLLRLADLAVDEVAYLEGRARAALARAALNRRPSHIVLSTVRLAGLPPALLRRVVRQAVAEVRGDLAGVEYATVDAIVRGIYGPERPGRAAWTLPGASVEVTVSDAETAILRAEPPMSAVRVEYPLAVPGEVAAHALGIEMRCRLADPPADVRRQAGPWQAFLDVSAVRPPLVVRPWRPGDRMKPLGMPGSRKLQDILTDRKVGAAGKARTAVVADAAGIVWVPGYTIAERGRVGAGTQQVLVLAASPVEPSGAAPVCPCAERERVL